jgi:prepilin-type N-terminal cleavage/methylation domain-containing protein
MKSGITKMNSQAGFTLVEVVLAILVVALGLLSVFSLFPSGLRASEDTVADTRAGLFAETVFNGMRANATALTATSWGDVGTFASAVCDNLPEVGTIAHDEAPKKCSFSDRNLRYQVLFTNFTAGIYGAVLNVSDNEYGPFVIQNVFYTEFVNFGK